MSTLPPGQSSPSGPEPHRHRQMAESFGVDAERYDQTRPPYPGAMVHRIAAASPGPRVLDVGCGTGIAARQFQAAGCTVLGVDPDARMADVARRNGIEVEVATFESWDPAGRSFDAVIAGTAWHWVDPVAGPTKAAQVLRPGGVLAVFGHAGQLPSEVLDALAAAYERVVPDSPISLQPLRQARESYQGMYATFTDAIAAVGRFGDLEQWRFDWERPYTRDEWLELMPTQGSLTRLPPERLAELLEAVGAAIDAMGGGFTMPYATVGVTAIRDSD